MIFAPFTGKDNHGRPVTFAAGLLSKEDGESFSWLFSQFLKSVREPPKMIITDQDLGMKVAIERVLFGTRHRWCMWHIMLKLSDKLPKALLANEDVKKELKACVWSELIEPDEFEELWGNMMRKFGLENEEWFKTMYGLRQYWVPAYFRDFPMSSLMKTTSISECENSFFKRYSKPRSNLLEFIMNFNHALDDQRNQNAKLNYLDSTIVPRLATKLCIEKHAATIYTDSIFKKVQEEIVDACYTCRVAELVVENEVETYKVVDKFKNTWTVKHDMENSLYECGCKMYGRTGLLCSHLYFLMKNKDMKLIPEKYQGGRWLKSSLFKSVHGVSSEDCNVNILVNDKVRALNKLFSSFYGLVQRVEGNIDQINSLTATIEDAAQNIFGDTGILSNIEKKKMIEEFYGSGRPDVIQVHPPNVVKTKGSGSRLVSRREKIIRDLKKPARRCAKCGEMGHHDSRNCDKIKEKIK